jgi:hypothetical protein
MDSKELAKERTRLWRQEHKEQYNAYMKEYIKKHKDEINEKLKSRYIKGSKNPFNKECKRLCNIEIY